MLFYTQPSRWRGTGERNRKIRLWSCIINYAWCHFDVIDGLILYIWLEKGFTYEKSLDLLGTQFDSPYMTLRVWEGVRKWVWKLHACSPNFQHFMLQTASRLFCFLITSLMGCLIIKLIVCDVCVSAWVYCACRYLQKCFCCSFAWSDVTLYGVHRMCQGCSSCMRHQPCNNQTVL